MSTSIPLLRSDFDLNDYPKILDDGERHEIVNGELWVSTAPAWEHERARIRIARALDEWSEQTGAGLASLNPGVVSWPDAVIPDALWISNERLERALGSDGRLHEGPDLVVEVLSPGSKNVRRDTEAKLAAYTRLGVLEYWIVDLRHRLIEVFRACSDGSLELNQTLCAPAELDSQLLPGFSLDLEWVFPGRP